MKAQKKPGGETRQELNTCKDKDFQPIERNTSLQKLTDLYIKSFDEFTHGFPPCTPTQYLFDLHDMIFSWRYLKFEDGRRKWKV